MAKSSRKGAPPAPAPVRSWKAHAVGAFIALHLIAVTLKAIPTPEAGMVRATWKDPTVQKELHAWADKARGVGFHWTNDQFEDVLWDVAVKYCDVRYWVLRPFEPYYKYFGTYQSWPMFIAPQRFPTRFSIDIEEGGTWKNIFTEDDSEHAWMATELGDTRFRSVLFRLVWPGFEGELQQFTDWVARRAAHDFPQAERARVRLFHFRSPSPEEVLSHAAIDGREETFERDLRGLR